MLYLLPLSPFIHVAFLVFTAHAGTPPRYPFDKPGFGAPRCDNSLPNPPKENPVLKKAALEKVESTGGNSAGRSEGQLPVPYLPPNSLRRVILAPIVASPDPAKEGVLPASLFQYWEQPILYHVFGSATTTNLLITRDPTTIDKVNSLVSDVLNTCCQFGFDGAAFGKFSETEGDYLEVHVQFSPTPPPSSGSLAIEGQNGGRRGALGFPFLSRVGNRPSPPRAWSSALERIRPGRMVLSPSREDLLKNLNSTTPSPAGSGELYAVPEGAPATQSPASEGPYAFQPSSSRRLSTGDIETGDAGIPETGSSNPWHLTNPRGNRQLENAEAAAASRRVSVSDIETGDAGILETGPSNPRGTRQSENAEAAAAMQSIMETRLFQTGGTQFSAYVQPEEQVLLRQCRDAMVELNMRGQTQQEATTNEIELRETWCRNCCPGLSNFLNNHQGATGCCIMSMVFVSTVFTVLNYIHSVSTNSTSPAFPPPAPLGMLPGSG